MVKMKLMASLLLGLIPSGGSLGVGNGLGGAFHVNSLPAKKLLVKVKAISIAGIDTDSAVLSVSCLLIITITADIFSSVIACDSGSELGLVDKMIHISMYPPAPAVSHITRENSSSHAVATSKMLHYHFETLALSSLAIFFYLSSTLAPIY